MSQAGLLGTALKSHEPQAGPQQGLDAGVPTGARPLAAATRTAPGTSYGPHGPQHFTLIILAHPHDSIIINPILQTEAGTGKQSAEVGLDTRAG